jgi:hypothetical protein
MKNVRLIFVLLLIVNCTADLSEIDETSETSSTLPQAQLCIDDLPRVMLTNNGTHSFDFIVYADDYSVLHTQNLSTTTDSGWVELSSNNVIIVVTNNTVYGQKIQLNLVPCDNKE